MCDSSGMRDISDVHDSSDMRDSSGMCDSSDMCKSSDMCDSICTGVTVVHNTYSMQLLVLKYLIINLLFLIIMKKW